MRSNREEVNRKTKHSIFQLNEKINVRGKK